MVEKPDVLKQVSDQDLHNILNRLGVSFTPDLWKSFNNTVLEKLKDEEIEKIKRQFPQNINLGNWNQYLDYCNGINQETVYVMNMVKQEKRFNLILNRIYNKCRSDEDTYFYTSLLTPEDGNCLFHALVDNGIGKDHMSLRRGLAYIMYLFKSRKDFFDNPSMNDSFEDLFACYNEIQIVYSKKQDKAFKFNYDLMCYDMAGDTNFSSTLTELLLMVISQLYKVEFKVYHSNGTHDYVSEVSAWKHLKDEERKEKKIRTVYLGQMEEMHFISIKEVPTKVFKRKEELQEKDELTDSEKDELKALKMEYKYKEYKHCQKSFLEWGRRQAIVKFVVLKAREYFHEHEEKKAEKERKDDDEKEVDKDDKKSIPEETIVNINKFKPAEDSPEA